MTTNTVVVMLPRRAPSDAALDAKLARLAASADLEEAVEQAVKRLEDLGDARTAAQLRDAFNVVEGYW